MLAKRLFDFAFASLALVVLCLPMLVIGAWVRIDSRGPALFRQTRVGRHGKPFSILKFRTMRPDAAACGPGLTIGPDRRITRAGAFLRRYKLDELPQFINVLSGDMSIVGPRPEVPQYVAYYSPEDRDLVMSVRPGITDRASIEFRDESAILGRARDPETAYRDEILPVKLAYYRAYVRNRSFSGDLAIILATVRALMA